MAHATTLTVPAPSVSSARARTLRSFGLLRESWVGMIGVGLVLSWVAVLSWAAVLSWVLVCGSRRRPGRRLPRSLPLPATRRHLNGG